MNQLVAIHPSLRSDFLFKAFLTDLLSRKIEYVMPGNLQEDKYILPVSGGADSTALAVLLHAMFPLMNFIMVFTDTMAEEPGIYETLDQLENYLEKPITRIVPERGLYELIEHYDGFLPSANARWCTRELKLVTFRNWLKQYDGVQKHMFVGFTKNSRSNFIARPSWKKSSRKTWHVISKRRRFGRTVALH
jgi:3'-phosphoadenosine 5'-phosphosulfate sulfotransferase (PAPS reductase)/FAD synthetase